MFPLVTISIPLFKCEGFLKKCLDSVRFQTFKNIEVILVNDQTPDHSVEIAENYIKNYHLDSWRIIHLEQNSGLSVVRNKGIDEARGKYLFFLDSDDTITPDCIEKLVEISEKTGAEMTMSQLECEQLETGEKSIPIKINTQYDLLVGNDLIFSEFSEGNLVTYAVNKLFLVDYLWKEKLYFIPELFAQDELWTFHSVLKMNKIAVHKGVTYTYFLHGKSVIHNRTKKNFDNWFTIGQYIDKEYRAEKNPVRRKQILKYLVDFKRSTLLMNWKAQHSESLWKESYRNYQTLSSLKISDYFSPEFSSDIKKQNFLNALPVSFGYRIFKWRYDR